MMDDSYYENMYYDAKSDLAFAEGMNKHLVVIAKSLKTVLSAYASDKPDRVKIIAEARQKVDEAEKALMAYGLTL